MFGSVILSKLPVKFLIILMHGYGTNYTDFLDIGNYFEECCPSAEIHILNAFDVIPKMSESCRQWFPLNCSAEKSKNGINDASHKLKKYIDETISNINSKQENKLSYENVILAGFSQGAMMSIHVGLILNVRAVIAFSGLLVDSSIVHDKCSTKFLFTHGKLDDVCLLGDVKKAIDIFSKHGIYVEQYIEDDMYHSISFKCLDAAKNFLKEVAK